MNTFTTTIARYMYAVPFAVFGLIHFISGDQMAGMVPLPGGVIWIYITGLGMILASISLIIQKKAKLAAFLLGIMLIVFVLTIHLPSLIGGDHMAMTGLLKDLALAGAAFTYSGLTKD